MMFGASRKYGKAYSQLLNDAQAISEGKTVGYLGIDEAKAKSIIAQLAEMGCNAQYKPMIRTPRPEPIWDVSMIEERIVGMQYFEKEISGYVFSQAQQEGETK